MVVLESSAIRHVWCLPNRETLLVTFVTGKTYAYAGVPPSIYQAFQAAESRGRFFNARIRDRCPFHLVRG